MTDTFLPAFHSFLSRTVQDYLPSVPDSDQPPPSTVIVHPSRRLILQELHPNIPNIQFSSRHQAELLELSVSSFHVFGILPTGAGKSVAIFGPALIHPTRLVVVVTPFIALTDDLDRKLSGMNISGGKWCDKPNPHTARIILVSAHEAGSDEFVPWLEAIKPRLLRVVFDEAHHILLSADYRQCFKNFPLLTRVGVPFTFLSATLKPSSVTAICDVMNIPLALVRQVRASTARPNIQLAVSKVEPDHLFSSIHNLFHTIHLQPLERGLIFCTTRTHCEDLAAVLNLPFYIGPMHEDPAINSDRKKALDLSWRSGETPWMVCTLCFGQGIDQPHVRWVLHLEVRNMTNFWQEIGRAGRDRQPAFSHVFYSSLPKLSSSDPDDHAGVKDIRAYLDTPQCRRISLRSYDTDPPHSCGSLPFSQHCDYCSTAQASFFFILHFISFFKFP